MTNDLPTPPPMNLPETVAPPEPAQAPRLESTTPIEPPPSAEEAPPHAGADVPEAAVTPAPAQPEMTEEAPAADETPAETEPAAEPETPTNKRWYVIKVQSGREESIKEAIERRVKIENLEEFFGQIIIPTERVVEMRHNKRVYKDKKLYPGYLMAEVEFNDRILYLFRETSGVGDFVGASVTRAPTPMSTREVEQMLRRPLKGAPGADDGGDTKVVHSKPPVERGDRVKIKEGPFANMEGEIKEVIEAKSQVKVEVVIWGRPVPVDLEYWQVEAI
jgi:transcription termination/antitermination protein NusG